MDTTTPDLTNPTTFAAELAKAEAIDTGAPTEEPTPEPEAEPTEEPAGEGESTEEPAAEPEPEGEPEPEDEADDDGVDYMETDKGKAVPKGRFQHENKKRKEAEARTQAERDARIAAETRLANMEKALDSFLVKDDAPAEPGDTAPLDPESHNALKKEIDELKKGNAATAAHLAHQTYSSTLSSQQEAFTKDNPDFGDAFAHVKKMELAKAKLLFANEKEAKDVAGTMLANIAAMAYRDGKNVASTIYDLAKATGYQTKKSALAKPTPNLDAIESNMKKTKSVANMPPGSGTAAMGDYTRQDNFDKLKDKTGMVKSKDFHAVLAKIEAQGN